MLYDKSSRCTHRNTSLLGVPLLSGVTYPNKDGDAPDRSFGPDVRCRSPMFPDCIAGYSISPSNSHLICGVTKDKQKAWKSAYYVVNVTGQCRCTAYNSWQLDPPVGTRMERLGTGYTQIGKAKCVARDKKHSLQAHKVLS